MKRTTPFLAAPDICRPKPEVPMQHQTDHLLLPAGYFQSADVPGLARDLLGKFLLSSVGGEVCGGMIVETEAYRGPDDKACHAWGNRRTKRTEVMFGPGGHAYVYLCYGIHHLFNIVTGEEGAPHAVLVRALEPTYNPSLMQRRRRLERLERRLTAGPGMLTQALGIDLRHNGARLSEPGSPLWLEDRGVRWPDSQVMTSPRVGVSYAGACAAWPWRFRIRDNRWTSPVE
jgi:DNA-3-methyladenine glycosylase